MISSSVNTSSASSHSEFVRFETLFNSVEVELTRRWAHGNVPTAFTTRPVEHLHKVVDAWWQIYHESSAAAAGRNRTVWEHNPAYAAVALDTGALIDALRDIRQRIDLDAFNSLRSVHQAEHSAIGLLDLISAYYVNINNQTPP